LPAQQGAIVIVALKRYCDIHRSAARREMIFDAVTLPNMSHIKPLDA
jgi:hypothetical protein